MQEKIKNFFADKRVFYAFVLFGTVLYLISAIMMILSGSGHTTVWFDALLDVGFSSALLFLGRAYKRRRSDIAMEIESMILAAIAVTDAFYFTYAYESPYFVSWNFLIGLLLDILLIVCHFRLRPGKPAAAWERRTNQLLLVGRMLYSIAVLVPAFVILVLVSGSVFLHIGVVTTALAHALTAAALAHRSGVE